MARWQTWTVVLALGLAAVSSPGWASPPHWAPAHGYRRHTRVVYRPAPFVYRGYTYIPLREVTSLLGVTLVWNSPEGSAVLSYSGRSFGLFVGNTTFFFGAERVLLPAPPILVDEVVYVPVVFVERYLRVPVERSSHWVKLRGPRGWHEYTLVSRPPGRVVTHYRAPRTRVAPARTVARPHARQAFEPKARTRRHEVAKSPVRVREERVVREKSRTRERERVRVTRRAEPVRVTGRPERGAKARGGSHQVREKGHGNEGRGRGPEGGQGGGHSHGK